MRIAPIAAALLLAACYKAPEPLAIHNSIPPFTLTAQDGAKFRSADRLRGHVWIADFIFTTCTGPCPRMSTQMKRVQDALAAESSVRFVSFTVDPANDTPAALTAYAKRYGADPTRWTFLTGDRAALHDLSRHAFLLGDVDGSLNHSTRFVLVDREGRVRGYYGSSDADVVRSLVRDTRLLVAEAAS
ncbi:MAG: SCO family protein [Bryobacteraceae bacterium]